MTADTVSVDTLLDFLKRNRGFDFTGYKRSSLERRITKRMEEAGFQSYADYLDHLEVDPDEFGALFNTILINVTAFYRDASTWDHLRSEVIPELVARRPPESPIRVWCAGCASGEEAYTVAMVLADVLGDAAYRARVKIYATDVDDEALQAARAGTYTAKQVEPVPREALDRYFERYDSRYVIRQEMRRTVIFGRNDLVQDAPISRVHLLVCRNTLMYFNAETQARILRRFHFGLDETGVLVLGKSEMLITHGELFAPLDLKRRVFRKVLTGGVRERLHFVTPPSSDGHHPELSLRDNAFDAGPAAQVILDRDGRLVAVNHAARQLFGLAHSDLGRPIQDLEISYRPIELRSHLDRLRAEGRPIEVAGVRSRHPGLDGRVLDVLLTPLTNGGDFDGTSVSYVDVTHPQRLQEELERSKHDLEQAYQALQSTVEELETTNEELQSTNEELETTNEELQSTNEELETMNEELQSTNEELETINDELRNRSLELDEVNAFLETILGSMGVAVVVVDGSHAVQVWSRDAEDLWGLRQNEVIGENFLRLDIGLPVGELRTAIRSTLLGEGRSDVVIDAMNRRGRAIRCRVTLLPLSIDSEAATGVILLMSEEGTPTPR